MRYLVMALLILGLICSGIFVYVTSTNEQHCAKMYPNASTFELQECIIQLKKQTKGASISYDDVRR